MTRTNIVLMVGVVSVSFAAIFIRLAQAPALVIASYRLCLASLVLLPVGWTHSRKEVFRLSRSDILLALLAGIFLSIHFGFWIASLSYTSVASSVVLVTINPLLVAIASYFLFGERLQRQAILGIIVCIIGGGLVIYANWRLGSNPFIGGILALLGAIAAAGYFLIGRRLRQTLGIISYASLVYSTAGLLLLIATLMLGYPLTGYPSTTYLMLVLLALVPQLLGHSSLNWSLRFVSATLVTVAVLGEPVGASIWAFLILHEIPTPLEIIGGILILAGIFIALQKPGLSLASRGSTDFIFRR